MPEEGANGRLEERIKISGPEFLFGHLLHLANLLVGIVTFAILMQSDPKYASTIEKVKRASGFSMFEMINYACPGALLLSGLLNLAHHALAEPWRPMNISEKWTLKQCVPQPKSRIVSRDVLVSNVSVAESSNGSEAGPSSEYENWEEDYDQMLENENQETSERRKSTNKEDDYDYMG